MGTGVKASFLHGAAVFLLVTLLSPAPVAGGEESPVVLVVPLVVLPGTEEWAPPVVERILEEKLNMLGGFRVVGEEERQQALLELSRAVEIGSDELIDAGELAGADYAVVGQFQLDEETLNFDLRLFSLPAEQQVASFQKPAPAADLMAVLSEAALFVAEGLGERVRGRESELLESRPTRSVAAYRAFQEALEEPDPEKRFSLLEQVLELDPDYYEVNLRLGLELYRRGSLEEALPYMEKAAQQGEDVPETHNNLAVIYADLDRKKDALKEFKRALDLKSDYPEARLNYGRLLEESGRLEAAESEYASLLDDDPENFKARSSLAMLFERTGRTEEAIREFRILSDKTPELAENYFLEGGKKARKAKEFKKAEKFFLRAVDINPQMSGGYAELGTNSYLAEEYENSLEYFRQALALEPQRAEYHYYLGLALQKSGREAEAKESFERSAELGGPLETRVNLARVYYEAGDMVRAIEELNLILDEDPSQVEAKELLARAMDRAETDQRRAEQRSEFATHRLDRLESIIEDLTRTNRDLENRLMTLKSGRQDMENEVLQLRAEKDERERRYAERMEEAIRSIEELSKARDEASMSGEHRARVQELQEQLAKAEKQIQEIQALPPDNELSANLVQERARVYTLSGQVDQLEKELEATREKIGTAGADLEDREKVWKQREKDITDLRESLAALKTEKKTWEKEVKREKAGAKRLAKEAERLQDELEKVRRRMDSLQAEKEKAGRELSAALERGRAQAEKEKALSKDLDRSRRQVDDLTAEIGDLREVGGEREQEATGAREELAVIESAQKSLKRELEDAKSGARDLAAENARLSEDLSRVRQEGEGSQAEAADLKARLLAVELESLRKIEEARKQAASDVSARDELLTRYREKEQESLLERDRLQQSIADLRQRLGSAAGTAEALQQARLELAEQSLELGRINMRQRSWDKARLYFLKVLETDPRNREAYYSLGEIYFQLGRFDLSKQMYEKAKGAP